MGHNPLNVQPQIYQTLSDRQQQLNCRLGLFLSIAVSGWTGPDNQGYLLPWERLNLSTEQVSLIWESKYLKELGTALDRLIGSAVVAGVGEVLKLTARDQKFV